MNTYKTCDVVMLPVDKGAEICLYNKRLTTKKHDPEYFGNDDSRYSEQHLYILSSEEIREEDWVIDIKSRKPSLIKCKELIIGESGSYFNIKMLKYENQQKNFAVNESYCRKVIATTNTSLIINDWMKSKENNLGNNYDLSNYIPQISQAFINLFLKEYNEGREIKTVEVEYEEDGYSINKSFPASVKSKVKLKINPDNTISIKPIKESWNREEVIEFAYKLLEATGKDITATMKNIHMNAFIEFDKNDLDNWLDKNL